MRKASVRFCVDILCGKVALTSHGRGDLRCALGSEKVIFVSIATPFTNNDLLSSWSYVSNLREEIRSLTFTSETFQSHLKIQHVN